jgi:hypothetical protein
MQRMRTVTATQPAPTTPAPQTRRRTSPLRGLILSLIILLAFPDTRHLILMASELLAAALAAVLVMLLLAVR